MCNTARCQTCQTYGNRTNPLFEISVDDDEGVFECADCLHTDMVVSRAMVPDEAPIAIEIGAPLPE